MKNCFLFFAVLFLLNHTINAQIETMLYPNGANGCGTQGLSNALLNPGSNIGGWHRPSRSDIGGSPAGQDYFPILVVFVQFADEPEIPGGTNGYGWHTGQSPDWMDSVISYDRLSNSNWYDSYNAYQLSDYFHEFSRGKLHIIGKCVSITLDEPESRYFTNGGSPRVNRDIYDKLTGLGNEIIWPNYDKWTTTTEGNFV
ncbi:MAG: hypothetical protein L0Y76_09505 [Ignavibacteria bacterium]|nr:hypothetical protein [Ignavibacteria bacterium]